MKIHIEHTQMELTPELEFMLGIPNFRCGSIASILRGKGFKCKRKAESEQALVIHVMLKFYNLDRENWKQEFDNGI